MVKSKLLPPVARKSHNQKHASPPGLGCKTIIVLKWLLKRSGKKQEKHWKHWNQSSGANTTPTF